MSAAKKTRGARWLEEVAAAYELTSPAERLIAEEIASTIDAVDSAATPAEARLARTLLSRLIGQLALPADTTSGDGNGNGERPSMEGKSVRARRASEARWKRVRETEGRTF